MSHCIYICIHWMKRILSNEAIFETTQIISSEFCVSEIKCSRLVSGKKIKCKVCMSTP